MIKIVEGDITKLEVDAIVNAANENLRHGGGVARAIADAAGQKFIEESNEIIMKKGEPLGIGEPVYTSAGELEKNFGISYVIHVIGPRGKNNNSKELLEKSIENVLNLAKKINVRSIGIPAVSCGVFGFDKKQGAEIIFDVCKRYEYEFEKIILVSFDDFIIDKWREISLKNK